MRDSASTWFIVKKVKYSEVMLNIFELSRKWENAESSLVNANKPVLPNHISRLT